MSGSRLAMLGLGNMGGPIAANLLGLDGELVVWNRTAARADGLVQAGARLAADPREAVAEADVVVSNLLDDASMRELVIGEDGIAAAMRSGAVHICTTTISPECGDELSAAHAEAGGRFLAAPVVGRPPVAAEGKLILLCAGEAETIQEVRPVLERLGQRIVVVGDQAAQAYRVKLGVNFFLVSMIELFGELLAFSTKGGIDPTVMEELMGTMLGFPGVRGYLNVVAQARFDEEAGFAASGGLKDVSMMLAEARALGSPLPLAQLIQDRLITAVATGDGDRDWSVIAEMARRAAGL